MSSSNNHSLGLRDTMTFTNPRQLQQLWENRSPKTSDRIPPLSNWETSDTTTLGVSTQDIRESFVSLGVKPRVEET